MKKENKTDKQTLFHQLRNCLNPLHTFLEIVTCDSQPKLKNYQQTCRENLKRAYDLIQELERV